MAESRAGLLLDVGLRKMSEDVNLKGDYDRYYGWTSGFTNGQWGPIREIFSTCLNPLHRGHRSPYTDVPNPLTSVEIDVVELVNDILTDVDRAYPAFPYRIAVHQQ